MTVNAFWFGVLLTIVIEIIVSIVFAIVVTHKNGYEDESRDAIADEEQFKRYLKDTMLEIAKENNIILGELEDDDLAGSERE